MTSHTDIEGTLERLGQAWPQADSLVSRVLAGVESQPLPVSQPVRSGYWKQVVLCATASAVVTIVSFFIRSDHSLQAQVCDAVRKARSFQMQITTPAEKDKPGQLVLGLWYERGVGFREEDSSRVTIADARGTWRYVKDKKLAVQSHDKGIAEHFERILDTEIGQLMKGSKYERFAAADQDVNGQPCQAYLVSKIEPQIDKQLHAGTRRFIVLLDDQSRLMRLLNEVQTDNKWVVQTIHDCQYDQPIDASKFAPQFGDDVRLVDADAAFNEFVDLSKAVHREERQGVIFAIHQVQRFQGGVFFVTSVRGSDDTLKKYPLTHRRFAQGLVLVDGPISSYRGGIEPGDPGCTIELASLDHQGINVKCWILLPFDWSEQGFADTRLKVPAGFTPNGGAFGRENFTDKDGITHHSTWRVDLDIPTPAVMPTLESITGGVYADCAALDAAVPFKFLNVGNRGLMNPRITDLSKLTASQYHAAVVDDIRWWKAGCPQDDPRVIELRNPPVQK